MEIDQALEKIGDALAKWDGKTDTTAFDPLSVIVLFLDWKKNRETLTKSLELSETILSTWTKYSDDISDALR